MKKKSNKKTKFMAVLVLLMGATVVMGLGGISSMTLTSAVTSDGDQNAAPPAAETPPREIPCMSFMRQPPQQYRIHPHLAIIVNGNDFPIPVNIGLGREDCDLVIHTSDASGTIDVEPYDSTQYALGDFFAVWGKQFSKDQILDYFRDDNHEILMTVNGEPNEDYESLVLRDEQEIVLEYRKKAK